MAQSQGPLQAFFGNFLPLASQFGSRLHHIPAPAVVDAHVQNQLLVVAGGVLSLAQCMAHRGRQGAALTDKMQLNALGMQFGHFFGHGFEEQVHQAADFIRRAIPVFGRESENRQYLDATLRAGTHAAFQRLQPFAMTGQTRHEAFFGPAAIAIHHDGHMLGHRGRRRTCCFHHGLKQP